jgi:hypothetical protein
MHEWTDLDDAYLTIFGEHPDLDEAPAFIRPK